MIQLLTWPFRMMGWLLGGLIALLMIVFWVWAVYDCATRRYADPNRKTLWLIGLVVSVFLGAGTLAALAYLIFGREGMRSRY